jgi:hypothetical protein
MRSVREQPRAALAKILGTLCLVLVGVAIRAIADRGDRDHSRATEVRLVSARRSMTSGRPQLRLATDRADRADAGLRRAQSHARELAQTNRRLRSALRAARRTRHHTKKQP